MFLKSLYRGELNVHCFNNDYCDSNPFILGLYMINVCDSKRYGQANKTVVGPLRREKIYWRNNLTSTLNTGKIFFLRFCLFLRMKTGKQASEEMKRIFLQKKHYVA